MENVSDQLYTDIHYSVSPIVRMYTHQNNILYKQMDRYRLLSARTHINIEFDTEKISMLLRKVDMLNREAVQFFKITWCVSLVMNLKFPREFVAK